MKMVAFWQTGDTVINVGRPTETFEIIAVEDKKSGVWVSFRNFHTREHLSGYEEAFQRLGYVAYRKEIFIEAIALR